MDLSPDQKSCFDILMDWYSKPSEFITMGGFAGTGKTTLVSQIRNSLPITTKIAFCAYTGKAASVLRSKLIKLGINRFPDDYIGTIHGLIYRPPEDDDIEDKWILKHLLKYNLIICDESSMISEDIFNDLKSFHIPIIFIGDHGQIPPIEGTLNLMANPIIKLEKVHRFAEENPLTKISMMARLEGYIPHGTYSDLIHKVKPKDPLITEFINNSGNFETTAILCGFNNTRVDINQKIRTWKNFTTVLPSIGERVICLKNNKKAKKCPIYNGVLGTVKYIESFHNHIKLRVHIDGETSFYLGKVSKKVFNNPKPVLSEFIFTEKQPDDYDEDVDYMLKRYSDSSSRCGKKKTQKVYLDCFDFGYSATVHKAQGSEWERVMLIEQPCEYWSGANWNKWLYTAVTRSTTELLIVR